MSDDKNDPMDAAIREVRAVSEARRDAYNRFYAFLDKYGFKYDDTLREYNNRIDIEHRVSFAFIGDHYEPGIHTPVQVILWADHRKLLQMKFDSLQDFIDSLES